MSKDVLDSEILSEAAYRLAVVGRATRERALQLRDPRLVDISTTMMRFADVVNAGHTTTADGKSVADVLVRTIAALHSEVTTTSTRRFHHPDPPKRSVLYQPACNFRDHIIERLLRTTDVEDLASHAFLYLYGGPPESGAHLLAYELGLVREDGPPTVTWKDVEEVGGPAVRRLRKTLGKMQADGKLSDLHEGATAVVVETLKALGMNREKARDVFAIERKSPRSPAARRRAGKQNK